MKNMFMRFVKDEQGQDLIEYTLLMAFIALASAAIFVNAGKSISGIWGAASNQLSNAAAAFESWLLATPQIPLTLDPVLTNKDAEASATKAISNVYSIKSWPDSSFQNR